MNSKKQEHISSWLAELYQVPVPGLWGTSTGTSSRPKMDNARAGRKTKGVNVSPEWFVSAQVQVQA